MIFNNDKSKQRIIIYVKIILRKLQYEVTLDNHIKLY